MKPIPKNSKIIVTFSEISLLESLLNTISKDGYKISQISRDIDNYMIIAYKGRPKKLYPEESKNHE